MDTCNDPDDNHISVHVSKPKEIPVSAHHSSSIICISKGFLPPLRNGQEYHCAVLFDGNSLEVWLTDDSSAEAEGKSFHGKNYVRLFHVEHNFATVLGSSDFLVGFTAATGGLCQQQEITHFQLFR